MSTFDVKNIRPKNSSFKKRVETKKKLNYKTHGVMFFVLIIFILILFTYVLPSVTVVVVPETENLEKEFEIQLTTDESKANGNDVFVAKVFEVTEQGEGNFKATGEKDVGDKASGQAVFYNSTGRSQPLTTQIDLINDAGIVFVVKNNITVPSARVDEQGNVVAGEITTEIEAKEAGEKGNVGPGRINISALDIDRQTKVYGEIKDGLSGGNSEIVTVISQEDIDNAKEQIIKDLEPKIKEKLQKKAGADMYISDKLITYNDSALEHEVEVDSEAKDFDLKLNLSAKVLVYDNKQLRLTLRDKILSELPLGQTIAETEFGNLDIQVENFAIDLGLADLKIKAIFPVAEDIDLDEIKKNILGKKETEARRYILTLPNVKDVHFMFSLSLRDTIPDKESRVKVMLGEVK